ncbi:hypothetical protein B0H11DRAFT_2249455 [Mycena galericulata]|nr:hypothetical protein B0H11DRAFT_2249455 [Mycena galericulata]
MPPGSLLAGMQDMRRMTQLRRATGSWLHAATVAEEWDEELIGTVLGEVLGLDKGKMLAERFRVHNDEVLPAFGKANPMERSEAENYLAKGPTPRVNGKVQVLVGSGMIPIIVMDTLLWLGDETRPARTIVRAEKRPGPVDLKERLQNVGGWKALLTTASAQWAKMVGAGESGGQKERYLALLWNVGESAGLALGLILEGCLDFATENIVDLSYRRGAIRVGATMEEVRESLGTTPHINRLTSALYVALAVSPLLLVRDDSALVAGTYTKGLGVYEHWRQGGNEYRLNTDHPLTKVETILWRLLVRMALGEITATQLLERFWDDEVVKQARDTETNPVYLDAWAWADDKKRETHTMNGGADDEMDAGRGGGIKGEEELRRGGSGEGAAAEEGMDVDKAGGGGQGGSGEGATVADRMDVDEADKAGSAGDGKSADKAAGDAGGAGNGGGESIASTGGGAGGKEVGGGGGGAVDAGTPKNSATGAVSSTDGGKETGGRGEGAGGGNAGGESVAATGGSAAAASGGGEITAEAAAQKSASTEAAGAGAGSDEKKGKKAVKGEEVVSTVRTRSMKAKEEGGDGKEEQKKSVYVEVGRGGVRKGKKGVKVKDGVGEWDGGMDFASGWLMVGGEKDDSDIVGWEGRRLRESTNLLEVEKSVQLVNETRVMGYQLGPRVEESREHDFTWRTAAGSTVDSEALLEMMNTEIKGVDGRPLICAESARNANPDLKPGKEQSCVLVSTRADFVALPARAQQRILRNRCILLVDAMDGPDPGFNLESLSLLRDPYALCDVQDPSYRTDLFERDIGRVGRLEQLLNTEARGGWASFNALQNPQENATIPMPPAFQAFATHERALTHCQTHEELPPVQLAWRHTRWGIAAMKGAKSSCHTDAIATAFIEKTGYKLIALAVPRDDLGEDVLTGNFASRHAFDVWEPRGAMEEFLRWEFFVLGPGQAFYMASTQIHWVLSLSECIAWGHHFHCVSTMGRSVQSTLHDAITNWATTNANHATARWLMIRIFIFECEHILKRRTILHVPDVRNKEELWDVVCLLSFVVLYPALDAASYESALEVVKGAAPAHRMDVDRFAELMVALGCARRLIEFIGKEYEWKAEKYRDFGEMVQHAVLWMACAMARYKRDWDGVKPSDDAAGGSEDDSGGEPEVAGDERDWAWKSAFTAVAFEGQLAVALGAWEVFAEMGSLEKYDRRVEYSLPAHFRALLAGKGEFDFFLPWSAEEMPGGLGDSLMH